MKSRSRVAASGVAAACLSVLFAGAEAEAQNAQASASAAASAAPILAPMPAVPWSKRLDTTHERYKLANGLTVVLVPQAQATDVVLHVEIDVGSRDDPQDAAGMSILIERLLGDPSTRHIPRETKPKLLRALGANDWIEWQDSFFDWTAVGMRVPPSDVALALWILGDTLQFFPDGIDAQNVSRTLVGVRDTWHSASRAAGLISWRQLLGATHPYGRRGVVAREISPEAVVEHYKKFFVAKNATLVVAGRFDPAIVKPHIAAHLEGMSSADAPEPSKTDKIEPTSERRIRGVAPTYVDAVAISWPTAAYTEADDLALDAVAEALERRLRDVWEQHKWFGGLSVWQQSAKLQSVFWMGADVPAGESHGSIVAMFDAEIDRMRKELLPSDMFTSVQRNLIARKALSGSDLSERAKWFASFDRLFEQPGGFTRVWAGYEALTPEIVRSAADRQLAANRRVVVLLSQDSKAPAWGKTSEER